MATKRSTNSKYQVKEHNNRRWVCENVPLSFDADASGYDFIDKADDKAWKIIRPWKKGELIDDNLKGQTQFIDDKSPTTTTSSGSNVTGNLTGTSSGGSSSSANIPVSGSTGSNQSGSVGPQGPTGPAGTNGTVGDTGATGPQGLQGIQGLQGDTGQDGADGQDGATGPAGTNGTNGVDGQDGTNGDTGPTGPAGTNGTVGDTGATGPAGTNGTDGVDGTVGDTGPTGPAGTNGIDGVDGDEGPTGPAGSDAESLVTTNTQTGSYTLVLTDRNKIVEIDNAATRTVTVPTNATIAFPIGTQIMIARSGTGDVEISASSGVTINASNANYFLQYQYSGATLIKKSTDEWWLFGDLYTPAAS